MADRQYHGVGRRQLILTAQPQSVFVHGRRGLGKRIMHPHRYAE